MTYGDTRYLDCPVCDNPCTAIPSCQEMHSDCMADVLDRLRYSWCEDRAGICTCGAVLHISVDDDRASLVEDETEALKDGTGCDI